jgi:alpha-1,3-rhamnosyl/mannosyltransferase
MRILINGLAAAGPRTGIGHYTTELARCLDELAGPDTIHLFQPDWVRQAKGWLGRLRHRVEQPRSALPPRPGQPRNPGWRAGLLDRVRRTGLGVYRWRFRGVCRRGDYDLYHEPSFLPVDCDLPTVVTIHDLSVLLHPEWHPADRVAQHQREFERGVARAVHVLAISECARLEIIRTLGLPADRVTRTYMGVRPGLRPMAESEVRGQLEALGLPRRYLLYLGTIEPRKNVLMLLRAYCALPSAVRERYPLVLVGGWGWNSGDVHTYLHEHARHRGVIYLGYLPEEHLGCLYNGARALLFPSCYEGFGLPPVEMLACGGAVLASTAGAVVETAGRAACLLHPDDLDAWRAAIERVCLDDDWCQSLRQGALEAARPFTWERCAADTLEVYRGVVLGARKTVQRAA